MHQFLIFIFGIKLYMFQTVPLSIIRSFSLYTQQWYMSFGFADSLPAGSGQNVLILLASCQQTRMTYTIAVCTVKNSWWWTEELGKHVEFYSKNKFEILVHLFGFIIRSHSSMSGISNHATHCNNQKTWIFICFMLIDGYRSIQQIAM